MENPWFAEKNREVFGTDRPVAFVTGSSSNRVGRCIAELLLRRHFHVAFHGHQHSSEQANFVKSLQTNECQTLFVSGDLRESSNPALWLQHIQDRWGRVDLLVNSAAIWEPAPFPETTADLVKEHWEVNVLGGFATAQRFGMAMVDQESGGSIVNIGDWAVSRPYIDFSAYFISKGCVETMTRTLAVELAVRNPRLRVNAVLPGPVLVADETTEAQRNQIAQDCLLKRAGTAGDVAEAVYFLATSPFITGVNLPVDGGRTIFSGHGLDSVAHPSAQKSGGA